MKNLQGRFVLFLIQELFWILWNNSFDWVIWVYGLVIVVPVVLLFGGGTTIFTGVKLSPAAFYYSFLYILVFIYALIKSNIDVIFRVLHPKLPVRPGIVRIETQLKSPMARMILANSITLTPGTFVVDIRDQYLYIHWIEVCCEYDTKKTTQAISGRFENLLCKIYE